MKKLLRQIAGFVGLSGIGWLIDFSVYLLLGTISGNLVINNFISSWAGVTFVFIFATRKIFQNNSKIPLGWKYAIYMIYQLVLITLISRLLGMVDALLVSWFAGTLIERFSGVLSKIIVTPITMCLNFLVMKGVIEKM